ncbi:MAG TPA: lysophospholipid acyltransferase family protein [Longimicrobiales bacterium]
MIIRSLWVALNLLVSTLVLSLIVVIAALFGHKGRIYDWAAHSWSRWMLWSSGSTVTVEGMEYMRGDRAQIIASNHQSWFDVWALAAIIPKRYRFIAKEELRKIPLFGRAWSSAGHISVNRQDRAQAIRALDEAAELMRDDHSAVVIFPEGTRSPTGELLPFKKGAFMMALRTGIEIVPAAVLGSRAVQKKGDWRVRAGRIIVRFGPPIDSSQYDEAHREELMLAVRERIESMLHAPVQPERKI